MEWTAKLYIFLCYFYDKVLTRSLSLLEPEVFHSCLYSGYIMIVLLYELDCYTNVVTPLDALSL